jgi:hypothetical protein
MKRLCIRQAVIVSLCFAIGACGGRSEPVSTKALIGPTLDQRLATAQATDELSVIVTFRGKGAPTGEQLGSLKALGLSGLHLRTFPMAGVTATASARSTLTNRCSTRTTAAPASPASGSCATTRRSPPPTAACR